MSDQKNETALVLDDSPEDREIMRWILKKLSIDIIEASDLHEAIQASKQLTAGSVFFLDVILSTSPQTGLFILANRATKFSWLMDVKIIVTSGLGDTATIMKAMELGADAYVIKPYSEKLIKQKLIEVGVL